MSVVAIDRPTGCLVIDGQKVFPICLSNAPPLGGKTPEGDDAWAEVSAAGANFIRSGRIDWNLRQVDAQVAAERTVLDAAAAHGLHCWLQLGDVPNLPPPNGSPSANEQLLVRIATALKDHPALGTYHGVDEPANPNRPSRIAAAGLVRAYQRMTAVDPDHPIVIMQAPLGPASALVPYRPALDITGADVYPIAYPPGEHTDLPNKDISVVGDVTKKMVTAAGGKPTWIALQIAWSGVIPRAGHAHIVPRFPTHHEARFMAYQAIVDGARGLIFYGGNLTQVMRPRDAQTGWNWTYWHLALEPLLVELTSPSVLPALLAPAAQAAVKADAGDVELAARQDGNFLHVIAVRRSATTTSQVQISGLSHKHSGAPLTGGQVMFEYTQQPLPPPIQPDKQAFRSVAVVGNAFRDWFGPHEAHVYRFDLG